MATEFDIDCPVCGALPGQPCKTTVGRLARTHRARQKQAAMGRHPSSPPDGVLAPRWAPLERRRVLTAELASCRAKQAQLAAVIAYLEGELVT